MLICEIPLYWAAYAAKTLFYHLSSRSIKKKSKITRAYYCQTQLQHQSHKHLSPNYLCQSWKMFSSYLLAVVTRVLPTRMKSVRPNTSRFRNLKERLWWTEMYRKLEPAVIIKVNKLSSYSIITQFNKNHEDRSLNSPCKGKNYRIKFEMKRNHRVHLYHENKQS